MSSRRRPAAPGYRPKARRRYCRRVCVICEATFILDRVARPWSRARTCSTSCARRLGNRGRHAANCRHCAMVEEFRLAQDADLRRLDVAGRDEDAQPVTFRAWLTFYGWDSWEEPDHAA